MHNSVLLTKYTTYANISTVINKNKKITPNTNKRGATAMKRTRIHVTYLG